MPQKYKLVIADTSCFILLDKIDAMHILQLVFGSIITTKEIATEFRQQLPEWVTVTVVKNIEYQALLRLEVDNGEASAIALAIETGNALLILDDYKARKLAAKLDLVFTGTLGVLLKAKQLGVITQIKPLIEQIQLTNFRFSEKNFREILMLAGE